MKFNIPQNRHRAWPPRAKLFYNKYRIAYNVFFGFNCAYDIGSDQDDTNKLFGLGYYPWYKFPLILCGILFGLALHNEHHKDSIRVGWRYNPDTRQMALNAYAYVAGKRIIVPLCEVWRCRFYKIILTVHPGFYEISVLQGDNNYPVASTSIQRYHKKKLSFLLWLYFGGNRTAPNEMTIEMKKI